jgi:hypothetical protein
MANRSGSERVAGRGLHRQPPRLVDVRAADDDDGGGGPIDARSRSSTWERMLVAPGGEDDLAGLEDGLESLQASIAERLRAVSLAAEGVGPPPRSARRRRR